MQGEFSFFWSILMPAAMVLGSVILTYALYKHFAGKVQKQHEETDTN
jgi:hypothetical protein